MNDHEPRAVKVDDWIIDESSGEVLELPQNAGDKVEFLTYRLVELQRDMKAYDQPITLLKLALKRELEKLDLKSLQTQYGKPVIRTRTTRKGKVERLMSVQAKYELGQDQVVAIVSCASALDPKALQALSHEDIVEGARVPAEAIEDLIEETHSEWLQVSPVLKTPPLVERVK